MERKDIKENYKWKLDELYKDNNDAIKELKSVEPIVNELLSYKGKIISSSSTLLAVKNLEANISKVFDKVFTYLNLNYCLDTRNNKNSVALMNAEDYATEIITKLSFISVELSKLDINTLNKYIEEQPKLQTYKLSLEKLINEKEHILSAEKEELISTLYPLMDSTSLVFDKIDNADIILDNITDSKGNIYPLTSSLYSTYVTDKDEVLRKNAVYKLHEYYEKHKHSIATCLNNRIKTSTTLAKIRNYSSDLEGSLSDDNIKVEFYDKLISDVHNELPTLDRMMMIYSKILNKEMHIYDVYTKFGEYNKNNFSIEDMQKIISKSLSLLGDDYLKIVDKAWNENWVDYYETPGKTSGAFSSGCYETKPYILLNYTGSLNDVETLAHELGHSIHSYLSKNNQDYENYQYPIFLAEIASTTHEVLLNNYLLNNATDNKQKLYILSNILSNFRSTVFRQTQFAEFERITHSRVSNDENLTADDFSQIYLDLEQKYYGKNVIIDDIIKYECLRIPHFYNPFYVYKYATGLCIAYIFANNIINKKENATQNFIKFLKSGGKDYPLNILKECGIDVLKTDIVKDACVLINTYLDQVEEIIRNEE